VSTAQWSFPIDGLDVSRFHSGVAWITVTFCVVACIPAGLRWLRVAQREHYLAGSASRFAVRWWRATPVNTVFALVALAAGGLSLWWPVAGVITACAAAAGPLGLSLRGRTSPLTWTARLRRLAVAVALFEVAVVVLGVGVGLAAPMAVVAVIVIPLAVDLACWVTAPLERRLSAHFVEEASARLKGVDPVVVAVTGSFGKTSTKYHIAHLVSGTRSVVVTPASFNNRAGLARAINEQLADGTEVFVAEMGTYGPGEIADLCSWCPPDIAVITAIGPVHLERFGSEDRIVESKAEIIVPADDVVLQSDDARLGAVGDRALKEGKRVLRCSSVDRSAGVFVGRVSGQPGAEGNRVSVSAHGSTLVDEVEIPTGIQPTNLACAVAVALLLGVDPATIAARLHHLPPVEHRLSGVPSSTGVIILDDTYNSNPAGARSALRALVTAGHAHAANPAGGHRLAVVTPGMVELGADQFADNREFGATAAEVATDLVIVGRTNRRALEAGSRLSAGSATRVIRARHRDEAVEWVRQHLGSGDVVLYENDLPDHYP
jgi:UDP-N-acetylmuramoyl-tripeptide--D-alanyl-D-alanine ligase